MRILGRRVRPLKLGLCSGFAAVLIILALLSTQHHINEAAREHGWKGSDESELKVLDLRFGYSEKEVAQLFSNWGPKGREWYLICEAIDAFAFCPAYAISLTILSTALAALAARKTGVTALRHIKACPVTLMVLDLLENALQVLLLQTYAEDAEALPPWWGRVVVAGSLANQAKWWIARLGGAANLLLVAAALSPRLKKKPKPVAKQQ